MPQSVKIDQAATFSGLGFLSADPKVVFGSEAQEMSKDGTPKWAVQLLAVVPEFGQQKNEIVTVTVSSHSNPGDGLSPLTPVELIDLEAGASNSARTGPRLWFRCSEIRPTSATGPRRTHVTEGA